MGRLDAIYPKEVLVRSGQLFQYESTRLQKSRLIFFAIFFEGL